MRRVFTAGPPTSSAAGSDLRVAAVVARDFDDAGISLTPEHRAALELYLTDLVRPYGLPPPVGPFDGGHSYGEMGEALIRAMVGPEAPVDLLVLAFASPDVRPGRATATYLSHLCPGLPMAFAVCDQATAAPFTGLRLIREYARGGGCSRALLLAVEQRALFHEPAGPVPLPSGHAGCAVLCETTGPAGPWLGRLVQRASVRPDEAAALLADDIAKLAADRSPVTLIIQPGAPVAGLDAGVDRLRVAPPGRPLTGMWSELAQVLPAGDGPTGELVIMADYEPRLGYLSLATIEVTRPVGDRPGTLN